MNPSQIHQLLDLTESKLESFQPVPKFPEPQYPQPQPDITISPLHPMNKGKKADFVRNLSPIPEMLSHPSPIADQRYGRSKSVFASPASRGHSQHRLQQQQQQNDFGRFDRKPRNPLPFHLKSQKSSYVRFDPGQFLEEPSLQPSPSCPRINRVGRESDRDLAPGRLASSQFPGSDVSLDFPPNWNTNAALSMYNQRLRNRALRKARMCPTSSSDSEDDLLPYNLPPPYFTNLDGSVQVPESPGSNYGQVSIQGALSANNLTAGGSELESERQLRLPKRRNTLENYKMFPFSRQKSNRSEGDVPLTDLGSKVVSLTSYSSPLHLKPISFFPGQSSKNKRAKNKSCIVS